MQVIHNFSLPVAAATFLRLHGVMTAELKTQSLSATSSSVRGSVRLLALLASSDGREVWRSRDSSGRDMLTVRSRSLRALLRVRRERALIEDLHREGIAAAPRLIRVTLTAYSIEAVHELSLSAGKRRESSTLAAPSADPGREAVRLDLLDLLTELHSRSLSLNLAGVRGVGFRADGSVAVVDFSRVGEASFSRVRADNRWVESLVSGVVQSSTTVTRRIHLQEANSPGNGVKESAGALLRQKKNLPRARKGELTSARSEGEGLWARYRAALITTSAVVATCAAVALAITYVPRLPAFAGASVQQQVVQSPSAEPVTPAASPGSSQSAGSQKNNQEKPLDDPYALLTDLARARLEYLSGVRSDNPSVVPGSPAAQEDAELRARVGGATIEGGRTVVHEAQVITHTPTSATIRAVVSDDAATVGKGAQVQKLPATEPRTIIMTVERSSDAAEGGGKWRIREVTQVEGEATTG